MAQLKKIDKILELKRQTAHKYTAALKDLDITLPVEKKYAKSIYWLYGILAKDQATQVELMDAFRTAKIPA